MQRFVTQLLLLMTLLVAASSCRVARHISQDEAVLSRIEIRVDGEQSQDASLRMALRQKPYRRTFGFLPISAWIWHPDTLTTWHRFRHRLGTQPAVYSDSVTLRTDSSLLLVMKRHGYLDARVSHHTETHRQKAHVFYDIVSGAPRHLTSVRYLCADSALMQIINRAPSSPAVAVGQLLDEGRLRQEQDRLTTLIRNHGYYNFEKQHISFFADTLAGSTDVELTCVIPDDQRPWQVRHVHFVTNYDMMASVKDSLRRSDVHTAAMELPGYDVTWSGKHCYLRHKTLLRSCYLQPGRIYRERDVRDTYAALSRLHILRFVRIRIEPDPDTHQLDCFIELSPGSNHSGQIELDGTNTAGDLGFAVGATYQMRNLFRGSETFTTNLKGSYESLSGNVEKLINNNYQELDAEFSLEFPQFLCPFINEDIRLRSRATTTFSASLSTQRRPEYNRRVVQGGINYKWNSPSGSARHRWSVLDVSYVYLPDQTETFQQLIQNLGPVLYSSFASHFIVGTDYTLYMGNSTLGSGRVANVRRDLWSLRFSPEIVGNVLNGVCNFLQVKRDAEGRYKIFDQPFEQYARFDVDWSYSHYLTDRSRLALHGAGGVAVPYGNSNVMPFEKRYYSGGANSVRGWSVRELGPGRYASHGSKYNYFNQCGDIRLDASVEVRTRLFWKFESAAFIDAGNVWTVKEYDNQIGGQFTSQFYKQIAASWGLGLRVVTDFFILRIDWGFKAFDPSADADEAWAIRHPLRSNHNTLHFAVGYPF